MKTKFLLVATLVVVAMTSCKRSYICECTQGGTLELANYSKKDALSECDEFAEWAANQGGPCVLNEK